MGLHEDGRTTARSEGVAQLQLDATQAHQQPLDLDRLYRWHYWLFPSDDSLLARPLQMTPCAAKSLCRSFPGA